MVVLPAVESLIRMLLVGVQLYSQFPGIRMVVARKVRKTLLETTWKTLNDVQSWGLKKDIHYHVNNVTYVITFWNGSEIIAMDLTPSPQDPDFNSLGSLEITGGCFIDEVSEVSEKAVGGIGFSYSL